jgi:hypothetical protein
MEKCNIPNACKDVKNNENCINECMDIIVNESNNNPNFLDSCPGGSVSKFCGGGVS